MANPVQNINHSAFMLMFEREKLSANNFNDWFRQLKLVLRVEKKMHVIEQPILPAPVADSVVNMLVEWNAVYDAHNEVACLMLGSMTPELHRQFKNYSPYEMLQKLRSMFEKQAGVERFDQIQTFHDCKQEEEDQLANIDFVGFVRNYNMRNMGKTIGELHALLIEYEKGKGKRKDKSYIPKPKHLKPNAKEHPTKNDACHHCKEGLRVARKLKQGDLYLYVGNEVRAQVEAIGSFDLVLPNGLVICLDNCHYAPSITRGVVLVSRLVENGFVQCFMDFGISVSRNNVLYFNAISSNGIYEIDMSNHVPKVNSIYNVSNKRVKHNLDSTYLWHCRLAHIKAAARILNMFPTKKVDKTPYELWFGKVPNLSYLKVWGCEALVKRDTLDKLQQRSVKCIFIGYPKETMGCYFYFLPKNKIVVARYAEFFEKNLLSQEVSGRAGDLEEIQNEDTSPSEITSEIPMEVEGFEPPQKEKAPFYRSERPHRAPDRLCLNVEVEEHSLGDLNEPANYKAAMLDPESDKWLDAMNTEMQSMKDNQVWRLVDLIAIAVFYDYEIW
uniref:Retrotransposon protein, putative, Ty1-copia subclass n=1 Tax=Tanacetum cinerariifolium TaxID=118510 RepID=A0A699IZX9_TANCI|nr:retrotransposon protein, putative, Ty1-copia subclass [Tanacetum cinerariifolium]